MFTASKPSINNHAVLPGVGQPHQRQLPRAQYLPSIAAEGAPNGIVHESTTHLQGNFSSLEHRVEVTEQANHALLDEAERLQADLKSMVQLHHDDAAEARAERDELAKSVREQRQSIDALLHTVAQLETRAQQAENRAQNADSAVADLRSALRSHLEQQTQTNTKMQSTLAAHQSKFDEVGTATRALQNDIGSRIQQHTQLIQTHQHELSKHANGIAATESAQAGVAKAVGDAQRQITAVERNNADRLASVEGNLRTAMQQISSKFEAATTQLANDVADGRQEFQNGQSVLSQNITVLSEQTEAAHKTLRGEISSIADMATTGLGASAAHANKIEAALVTEAKVRSTENITVAGRLAEFMRTSIARMAAAEQTLHTQGAALAVESRDRHDADTAQAAALDRTTQSVSTQITQLKVDMDAHVQQQRHELNNEIMALKDVTEKSLVQLEKSSAILERELTAVRTTIVQIIDAEIRSRQRTDKDLEQNIDQLGKTGDAHYLDTSTRMEKLAGMTSTICNQLQSAIQGGLTEQKQLLSRLETETDARLSQVVEHLGKFETDTSHSVSGLSGEVDSTRRHAERHVTSLEDRTARQLQALQQRLDMVPLQIDEALRKIALVHTEMQGRMERDANERASEMDAVQLAIARKADCKLLDKTADQLKSRLQSTEEKTVEIYDRLGTLRSPTATATDLGASMHSTLASPVQDRIDRLERKVAEHDDYNRRRSTANTRAPHTDPITQDSGPAVEPLSPAFARNLAIAEHSGGDATDDDASEASSHTRDSDSEDHDEGSGEDTSDEETSGHTSACEDDTASDTGRSRDYDTESNGSSSEARDAVSDSPQRLKAKHKNSFLEPLVETSEGGSKPSTRQQSDPVTDAAPEDLDARDEAVRSAAPPVPRSAHTAEDTEIPSDASHDAPVPDAVGETDPAERPHEHTLSSNTDRIDPGTQEGTQHNPTTTAQPEDTPSAVIATPALSEVAVQGLAQPGASQTAKESIARFIACEAAASTAVPEPTKERGGARGDGAASAAGERRPGTGMSRVSYGSSYEITGSHYSDD
eukprot:m.10924 g.10924  ORF g.10924 m.10924 type:complete len:1052 (+) comp8100_c0_seq1:156-3311(+)